MFNLCGDRDADGGNRLILRNAGIRSHPGGENLTIHIAGNTRVPGLGFYLFENNPEPVWLLTCVVSRLKP